MKAALPEKFKDRMKSILADEYPAFISEIENEKPSSAFFSNAAYAPELPAEFLLSVNAKRVPFCSDAYYFDAEKIGNTPLHHAGAFYVQDPSAMSTLCAVNIRRGWKILDMCASPGGKTLYAALKAGDEGFVVANEYNVSRCKTLVGNVERLGASNVAVLNTDASDENGLSRIYPKAFDLVIADVPCSGEGMFRKYPMEAADNWSEENISLCAARQKKILENAAKCVKPGGCLVYSTCTFSTQENETQILEFLSSHSEFALAEVSEQVKKVTRPACRPESCTDLEFEIEKARRFYPHLSRGEGQFIALMQNKDEQTCSNDIKNDGKKRKAALCAPSKEQLSAISDFANAALMNFDISRAAVYGDNLIYVGKNALPLPEKRVFSGGVKLGELSKGRLVPHHQLFKALGADFRRKINLHFTDERCIKYLRGETFEYDIPDGWCAVLIDGFPAGGAKAVGGVVKNHYPKGLRLIN